MSPETWAVGGGAWVDSFKGSNSNWMSVAKAEDILTAPLFTLNRLE